MSYVLSIDLNLGAGNAGLTLTPALFDSGNVAAAGLTTTTMVEVAASSGSYLWTGTVPDAHRGYISFSSGATFKTKVVLNPAEVENPDVKTSTRSSHTAADVWTSGTRTLTSFGTLVADMAAAVWAYGTRTLTMTAAQVVALLDGTTMTITRGQTVSIPITGLGNITTRTKLYLSVKDNLEDADTAAIIQVEETAGLIRLNGAAGTAIHGSLTVTDATLGNITFGLVPAACSQLSAPQNYRYDVRMIVGTAVYPLTQGVFTVNPEVTKAIT